MKILSLLILIISVVSSCTTHSSKGESILNYLKGENNSSKIIREYRCISDTSLMNIRIELNILEINNQTTELNYLWLRTDSFPICKSTEHYYTNNELEIVRASYYELDSNNQPLEVNANFLKNSKFSMTQPNHSFDAEFKFQTDKALTMKIHTNIEYEFRKIDSLDEHYPILVITTKDSVNLNYSDKRINTKHLTSGTRLYSRENGLIYFTQISPEATISYVALLKE